MIGVLQFLLMAIGAVTAVGFIVGVGGIVLLVVWDELVLVVRSIIQSHKDTKLFHQVEEFRRDFS